ncbi:protein trichome birefringence-like 1 [Silene latifolia]|uniref:protein trichome birefringence-like 1 n=1 Tax=Silene latifolia TaxID=37657 RepID=UPI003D778191
MADHSSIPNSLSPPPPPPLPIPFNLVPISHNRKPQFFAYVFIFIFLISTFFILFSPSIYFSYSSSSSSPWLLKSLVYFRNPSFLLSHHFPNSNPVSGNNVSDAQNNTFSTNDGNFQSHSSDISSASETRKSDEYTVRRNDTSEVKRTKERNTSKGSLLNCNIYEGEWVRDGSYPLYEPSSCPHIDEPFNCFLNHRPDNSYEKYRWQPSGCNIPRLNGKHMLEMLRGKRLVFVGDSLNRNMWESLICVLRNSLEDKNRVFEASGSLEFRSEGFYSFLFVDYNCSIEFFRTNFLVQELEVPDENGSKKETLRLDLVETASDRYKDADVLIFNTGHWWSHDKLTKGKNYYQEGSHIYRELNVEEAFRRALTTWARWVDANMDPKKVQIFFRGYSASHFSDGNWNTGGKCDNETKPSTTETDLTTYLFNIKVLEDVLKWMKMPVFYLNITTLTDLRIDAHPSIYRGQDLTDEERRSPLRYQDCSHWCLPGVPDIWNEFVYAQMLIRQRQLQEEEQREQRQRKIS